MQLLDSWVADLEKAPYPKEITSKKLGEPSVDKTDLLNNILDEVQELYQKSVGEYREQYSKGEFVKAAETITYGKGLLKAVSVIQYHHLNSLYKDAKDAAQRGV